MDKWIYPNRYTHVSNCGEGLRTVYSHISYITFTTMDFRSLLYQSLWFFRKWIRLWHRVQKVRILRIDKFVDELLLRFVTSLWMEHMIKYFQQPMTFAACFFFSHIFSIYHRLGMRCWDLGYEKKEETTPMSLAAKGSATKIINLF